MNELRQLREKLDSDPEVVEQMNQLEVSRSKMAVTREKQQTYLELGKTCLLSKCYAGERAAGGPLTEAHCREICYR